MMNDKPDYDLSGYVSDLVDVHMYGVLNVSRLDNREISRWSGRKRTKKKSETI